MEKEEQHPCKGCHWYRDETPDGFVVCGVSLRQNVLLPSHLICPCRICIVKIMCSNRGKRHTCTDLFTFLKRWREEFDRIKELS
jgi:hypothetical protein